MEISERTSNLREAAIKGFEVLCVQMHDFTLTLDRTPCEDKGAELPNAAIPLERVTPDDEVRDTRTT